MMKAYIKHISYYLPENKFTNQDIENLFPEWNNDKIISKIGVKSRRIAGKDQKVSDMAIEAIQNLCSEFQINKSEIDYLIICTQSPDYFLPATACIVQNKAGLPTSCGAIDINQGCSGYIYGLTLAKGLIISKVAKNVVLVTSEMYSKHIHPLDKGNRSIFGDAATATLISDNGEYEIGEFSLGGDGSGCENLMIKNGGMQNDKTGDTTFPSDDYLFMNGPEIFKFTAKVVPDLIFGTLAKNDESLDSVDQFLFHQANTYMLKYLKKLIKIPDNKFIIDMEDYGNTVSSTIPISLKNLITNNNHKEKILIAGFGVGYSWGAVCLYKN
ncbi:3-oxoacyl-ACP synthase III family protein [Apibacter sp. HY039]|uniref:3-oxoacyl-ACP synthase III family protein n=1 Tax=Apibacter sp. HY039 TaxID=2501476 RepID=UPI0021038533|nr:ketoacyl-ACP synthase III [Apibacter sp. HY039]